MKISKERLKQLIAEELSISIGGDEGQGSSEKAYDSDGRMAKQNLWKMAEYAKELYNLIDDEEDLEPWVEEKIAIASFMMDSVGHYMQYEKQAGHEESEMESGEDEYELDLEEPEDEEDYDSEEHEQEYDDSDEEEI